MKNNKIIDIKKPCTDYLERTPLLAQYFSEIRKFNVLTREEEAELFKLYKEGTPSEKAKAKEKIIQSNQRFIVAMAKKYGTNDNVSDLIDEGNIALIKAMDDYDLSRGTRFLTHAVQIIRRDINQYLMGENSLIRKSNITKTYHTISKATNKFIQRHERKPSTDELKEVLKEDFNVDVKDNIDLVDTQIASIDEHFMNDEDEAPIGDMAIFSASSASYNSYEKTADKDFTKRLVGSLLDSIKGKENERAKTIVKKMFGIGCDREVSVDELAEEFGLTTVRVRQICNETVEKMKENYQQVLANMD